MPTRSYLFLLLIVSIYSCSVESKVEDAPVVSHIDVNDIRFQRFDQDLADISSENARADLEFLLNKYPNLSKLYFEQILGFPVDSDSLSNYVQLFLGAQNISRLQDTIRYIYPEMEKQDSDLGQACQYLKYYFPEYKLPSFYTFQSEFGYQTIIFDDGDSDGVGIGLDFFLGEDFAYKNIDPKNPSFSEYLVRAYNKDHIVKKAIEIIVEDIVGPNRGSRFIDQMIHNGKKLYLMEKFLPHLHDTISLEFSKKDFDWLIANDREIWSFFIDNNLLYETNQSKIMKYLNPAPHSPGMPVQAPGRTASYIGLQIVKAFAERSPDISIQELVQYPDAQKLMEISKYKPRRR